MFFMVAGSAVAAAGLVMACSSSESADPASPSQDASFRKDGGPVEALEAGPADSSVAPPPPSCAKYCNLVMDSCVGAHAQYQDYKECLAFCAVLPGGTSGENDQATLACREVYAGSPAKTDVSYCPAAGPFGGGICGDRCTTFCQLTMAVCGAAPFGSYSDCASACVTFDFRDGGADGGGEGPAGPTSGDTLNCRLYHLRDAVRGGTGCSHVAADSGACR